MRDYVRLEELFEAARKTGATGSPEADKTGALIRHCMVAVSKKGKLKGGMREKARASRAICQASMTDYGYLKRKQGNNQPRGKGPHGVTQKGSRRNMRHATEKDNPAKQREYERLARAAR